MTRFRSAAISGAAALALLWSGRMFGGLDGSYALPLEHPPGTYWVYNTPAYRMLVRIVEIAVHEPVQQYMERRLTGPLGMSHTHWQTSPAPGGPQDWRIDRGVITAVTASSLTVHEADGTDVTVPLTSSARLQGVPMVAALLAQRWLVSVLSFGTVRG